MYGKENPDYTPPEADLKDPDNIAFRKQVHSHLNTNSVKNIVDGFDSTTCTGEFAPAYFDIDLEQNYILDEVILNSLNLNPLFYLQLYSIHFHLNLFQYNIHNIEFHQHMDKL